MPDRVLGLAQVLTVGEVLFYNQISFHSILTIYKKVIRKVIKLSSPQVLIVKKRVIKPENGVITHS